MRRIKKFSAVLILFFIFSSIGVTSVSAGSDGTIHIQPNNVAVKQGESVVVDLVSDTDLTANAFSAFQWAFDIGSFYIEQDGTSDFVVTVENTKGNIKIGAFNKIEITAGVPFCSLRFTALENARITTRVSNNIKSDVVTSNFSKLDVTADDIVITILPK